MKISRRSAIFYLVALAIFALMISFYFRIAQRIDINSDMASGMVEALDMSKGNILLSGWSLSTVSFYFTEIVWYVTAILVSGYSYKITYFMPAIMLAILCALMIFSSENKKTAAIFTLFMLGAPTFFMARNVLTPFIHIGTYIFCLAAYCLASRYVSNGSKAALAGIFCILALTYFSDTIALYISLVPTLAVVVVSILRSQHDKRWSVVLAVSVLSVATAMLINALFLRYGFVVPGVQPTKFATLEGIGRNISDLFRGVMTLFDADFYGRDPREKDTIIRCLSFFIIAAFIFIVALRAFKIKDNKDVFLLVATLIMPVAYIVSDVSVGVSSIRYILPFFIYGTVLISRVNTPLLNNARVFLLLVVLALIPSVHHIKETIHRPKALNGLKELSQVLYDKGLKHGYAEFWFASATSVYGQVQVAPINYNPEHVIRRDWLSKESWYGDNNRFIIIHDDMLKQAAIKAYGQPDDVIKHNSLTVFVWNKKLTTSNP